jgi:molybdopterin molybdotransferase
VVFREIARHAAWEARLISNLGLGIDLEADRLAPVLRRFIERGGNLIDCRGREGVLKSLLGAADFSDLFLTAQGGALPADPRPLLREGVLQPEDIVGQYSLAPVFLRRQLAQSLGQLAPGRLALFWLEGADAVLRATSETDLRFRLREAFAALEVAVAQNQLDAYGLALACADFPFALALETALDVLGDRHHFRAVRLPNGEVRLPDGTLISKIVPASEMEREQGRREAVFPAPLPPHLPVHQPKMSEFFTVLPPHEALVKLLAHLPTPLEAETIPINEALDRVTANSLHAPASVPAFPRSIMDGYAVRASDTFGASQTLPMYLTLIGEVPMGRAPDFDLRPGTCALVHTGGMLPGGADAVVMVELTQKSREDEVEVLKAVAPGENILRVGDDILEGAEMLPAGHVLRAQDLGGLAALGFTTVSVARRPRVALLATGDEIVPPEVEPAPGQVRDVNTYAVAGQVQRAGGIPVRLTERGGIAPDNYEDLLRMARAALDSADMLVLSAGSSVSVRDMTADVINALGAPGVLVHGVALKPGKPAILAVCGSANQRPKPVIGLPGNPVSAMVVADLFVVPAIYHLQGAKAPPQRMVRARLTHNVPSQAGRLDYTPARLLTREGELQAEPIFGKSNQIFTLVFADGMIVTPADSNGLQAGEMVEVRLF